MLNQLLSMSRRRLIALALIVGGALIAILLIVLWQAGLFDSAPPPATLQSAVQSVRQEQQEQQGQQAQRQSQASQPQTDAQSDAQTDTQQDEATEQETSQPQPQAQQAEAATTRQQQSESASSSDARQDQQDQQPASYDYGQQDAQQAQATQQSSQASQPQQAQQSGQSSQQSSDQQTVMTPEEPQLADLAGTWVLSRQGESFVGYRIGEELANIGTATAVGRTGDIEANLDFDGAAITSVTIVADLRTLKSDQSFRDGALRTRGIESDTYPFATFVLTEPIPIDALPTGEEKLSVIVNGSLDLHGVTNPVSIALEGQYVDGLVVVVGSTEIALADYDIEKPTGFRVLSIEDVGIMEFQLILEPAP